MTLIIALLEAFQPSQKFRPEGVYFGALFIDLVLILSIWGGV